MGIPFDGIAAEWQEDIRSPVHRHFPQLTLWADTMTLTVDTVKSRMRSKGKV